MINVSAIQPVFRELRWVFLGLYMCLCCYREFENSRKNKPKKKKKSASLDGSDEEFSDGGGGMVWNFLDVL